MNSNGRRELTGYDIKTILKEKNYRLKNHLNVTYLSGVIIFYRIPINTVVFTQP